MWNSFYLWLKKERKKEKENHCLYAISYLWKLLCRVWLFATPCIYSPWSSPVQNTGVGSRSLLQEIFPTQGLNPGLLHCGWILYQLSHQGSPRILEWVAYPFSRGSSWPRNRTRVSCMAGKLFTIWATREVFLVCGDTLMNKIVSQTHWCLFKVHE